MVYLLPIGEIILCIIIKNESYLGTWAFVVACASLSGGVGPGCGLCFCGPPGLPAASIWVPAELAVSCRWGRQSTSLALEWLPVSQLIWDGLTGLSSVFLTSTLPEASDLCKGRAPRRGIMTSLQLSLQHWPIMASSASSAKTNERLDLHLGWDTKPHCKVYECEMRNT